MTLEKQSSATIDFYSNDSLIKYFILSNGPRYIRVDIVRHDDEVIGYFHINKIDKSIIDNHIVADTEVLKDYLTPAREERILNYIKEKLNRRNILENMDDKILQQLFAFLTSLGFLGQDLELKQAYMLSRISGDKTCYVNIEVEDNSIKLIITGGYEPYVTEISKNIEELPLDFTLYMKEYINRFDGLENYKGKKTMKRKMNEEYGPLQGEPYIESISNDIEAGNTYGNLYYGVHGVDGSFNVQINGEDIEDYFQTSSVVDYMLREIAYPVRDGHSYYNGLDIIIYPDDFDLEDESVLADLEKMEIDTELLKEGQEAETWVDYDINLEIEEDEDMEENYKGKKTMKRKMNEDAKIIANLYNDFKPWSGAVETYEKIKDADMLEDLDRLLEEMYPDGIGMTELNDLLWFEDEWVLEQLGLAETEDEEVEESLQVNENLQQEYDEIIKRGRMPLIVIDTAEQSHEIYFEPQGDKLVFGGATNTGIIPTWEFDYDDSQSFDWNFQGMVEEIQQELWDEEGYPVDESLKSSRKSSRKMNENDEVDAIWNYLVDSYTATQKELELITSINGYSVETLNDVIYARTGMRNIEQLKQEYGEYDESLKPSRRRRAVSEISQQLKDKVTDARKKELKNADRAFVAARNKAWRETQDMEPKARKEAVMNNKKLDKAEERANRASRKLVNNMMLRRAQQESLSSNLIKSAHSVLSMNEGIGDEMNTWSFKAKGFSKMLENKQPTFGNQDLRCIIHENKDGNIEGVVVTNYAMPKEQVEESLKETLRQNGFRSTSISELTVLY